MTLSREIETELGMVEWHVREGEAHVARQREIVERLPSRGEMLDMARTLLAQHEAALALHRAHLTRLRTAS